MTGAGAEVGEEAEVLPDGKEGAALGLDVGGEVFPLGSANGAEEDGVGFFASGDRFRRKRGLVVCGIECGTTDEVGGARDFKIEFGSDGVEDFEGNVHDFWSDAVARKDGDGVRHGEGVVGEGGGEKFFGASDCGGFVRRLRRFAQIGTMVEGAFRTFNKSADGEFGVSGYRLRETKSSRHRSPVKPLKKLGRKVKAIVSYRRFRLKSHRKEGIAFDHARGKRGREFAVPFVVSSPRRPGQGPIRHSLKGRFP